MSSELSEDARMVFDAADRILREQCSKELVDAAEAGVWPEALWQTLESAGLTLACAPAALGGAELRPAEGLSLLRLVGTHAVPIPLAETMLATMLLGAAGAETLPAGPIAMALGEALTSHRDGADLLVSGRVPRVPFAPCAGAALLVLAPPEGGDALLALVEPAMHLVGADVNLAGEPRADLVFEDLRLSASQILGAGRSLEEIRGLLALSRALMIAGAMASVLDLGTSYALERKQFGRAIAKFQAVQQQLAVLAGEAAAALRAADGALEALDGPAWLVEVAVAKARAGEAAGRGAEIAHQVHGAMGFTHEHRLHHRTRRMWAWRDEYGHEAYWQAWLGRRIARTGAEGLWAFISGTPDAA